MCNVDRILEEWLILYLRFVIWGSIYTIWNGYCMDGIALHWGKEGASLLRDRMRWNDMGMGT